MVCNVGIHFSDPLRSTANVCGQWYIIHMTPTFLPQALTTAQVGSQYLVVFFSSPASFLNTFLSFSSSFSLFSFSSSVSSLPYSSLIAFIFI